VVASAPRYFWLIAVRGHETRCAFPNFRAVLVRAGSSSSDGVDLTIVELLGYLSKGKAALQK
jgi:hypothetical protein